MAASENAIRLNKTDVNDLEKDPAGNRFFPVDGYKGLCVQVTKGGTKSFVLRYRFLGRQKIHTLGTFPEMTPEAARKAHSSAWGLINAGVDPNQAKANAKKAAEEARQAAVTVADLAERFIAEHIGAKVIPKAGTKFKIEMILDANGKPIGNKESTAREHIRLLQREILPALGKLPLKEVGTPEIADFLFKARKNTPTQSNRLRSVLSKMFNKAEVWGMRPSGSNPVKGQDRAQERKKKRNLSDREIIALGTALRAAEASSIQAGSKRKEGEIRQEDPCALAALRLSIFAGMRKAEIIGDLYRGTPALTWKDVDLVEGVLRIHHKTEGKTGEKRTVYLCSAAKELMKKLPRTLGNPHVIPGEKAGRSLVNLQLVWDRIKKSACKQPSIDISDVTLHDLRRTFSSVGARMGYPELWIGALLGHSATTVTQGYARVDGDPLRSAVEAIGSRIAGLLDGSIDLDKEAEEHRKAKEEQTKKTS